MADKRQLKRLKKGVKVWNKWREEHPDEGIDLRGADLSAANLQEVNLQEARLEGADLRGADLTAAKLYEARLRGANLEEAHMIGADLSEANLEEARLEGANLTAVKLEGAHLEWADLRGANLSAAKLEGVHMIGADLREADLSAAKLYEADLSGANLERTTLINTNLSYATFTGAYLYGTARDDWKIDGVICDFIYWDKNPVFWDNEKGKLDKDKGRQWERDHRVPKDRDFRPGEFEELYKQLPTFDYYFEQGFTPLDPLIMDRVVQTINERQPEIELTLKNFEVTGTPHATFTVLHKDNVEDALREVTAGYESRLKVLEGQKEQLMQVIAMLGSGNVRLEKVEGNAIIVQVT